MNVTVSKEIKVGLALLIALAILYIGINFLKGRDLFNRSNKYSISYKNVEGLTKSNNVVVNGLKVGQVEKVYLDLAAKDSNIIKVDIIIQDPNITISSTTTAAITSVDFLGTKAIKLDNINSGAAMPEGSSIKVATEKGMMAMAEQKIQEVEKMIEPVTIKAAAVLSTMDVTLHQVNSLLDAQVQRDLKYTIQNLSITSKNAAALSEKASGLITKEEKRLDNILASVQKITSGFEKNGAKIDKVLANVEKITDDVAKANLTATIQSAKDVLDKFNTIASKIDKGEGSIGKLLKDDGLYNNLNKSAADLDALFVDLKANPKKYVHFSLFGGKKDKTTTPVQP